MNLRQCIMERLPIAKSSADWGVEPIEETQLEEVRAVEEVPQFTEGEGQRHFLNALLRGNLLDLRLLRRSSQDILAVGELAEEVGYVLLLDRKSVV